MERLYIKTILACLHIPLFCAECKLHIHMLNSTAMSDRWPLVRFQSSASLQTLYRNVKGDILKIKERYVTDCKPDRLNRMRDLHKEPKL